MMELKKQTEGHPEFDKFDGLESGQAANGNTNTSAAGTPTGGGAASTPKLKLTFNNSNRESGATVDGE